MTKNIPIYNVTVTYQSSNGKEETKKISSRFTRWFNQDGFFVAKPFQQWLASEVAAIGRADPANAKAAIAGTADGKGGEQPAEVPTPSPRKRGRPRKDEST